MITKAFFSFFGHTAVELQGGLFAFSTLLYMKNKIASYICDRLQQVSYNIICVRTNAENEQQRRKNGNI